ncbi:MAG: VWA domain-containing protein [Bacteroidetes bacterium]|nr:VWA domain-containing protein [Bacteroidota bacterium]
MATNDFYSGEAPQNYQQKCAVVFVMDVSGSMGATIEGKIPIDELNKGLQSFQQEIQNDSVASERLDIALVSFGSEAKVEHDFELVQDYQMPTLGLQGSTNLVDGMRKGMEILEERKKWYRETKQTYYRPYIILITDGYPDVNPSSCGLTAELKQAVNDKKFNFWPIGVEGADMQMLNDMASPGVGACLPGLKLDGLKFVELFQWLSSSFSKLSNSSDNEKQDLQPEADKNPFMVTVTA